MPPLARGRRQWHPPHHRAAATVAALALALALSSPVRAQPRLLTAALDAASGQLGAWVQGAYGRDSVPIRTPADVRALLTLPSGPILYKSNEAAMWAWAAQDGRPDSVPLEAASLTPLTGGSCDDAGGSLLVGYSRPRNAVVLAVNASRDCALETDADFAGARADMYRRWFATAEFDEERDDPLLSSLPPGATTLALARASVIAAANGDPSAWPPAAVHVAGFAWGGGLARGVALFAAAYVPSANVRCITFGAPASPDDRFEWATAQLVDLSYTWAAEGDPTIDVRVTGTPVATPPPARRLTGAPPPPQRPTGAPPPTLSSLDPPSRRWVVNTHTSKWVSRELSYSSAYYVVALQETFLKTALWSTRGGAFDRHDNLRKHFATKAAILTNSSNATATAAELKDMLTTSVDKLKRALAGREEHDPGSIPVAALPPDGPDTCKPVLCKLRRTVVQANNAYWDTDGSITDNSIIIKAPVAGTVVAVGWIPSTKTAVLAFRGSSSAVDWLENFNEWLTLAPATPVLKNLFPDARVHMGFLDQFQAVSDRAPGPTWSIKARLLSLTGGVDPALIILTGHSLGGAVATIGGVWASYVWPGADVRVVTFGAPATGNDEWSQAVASVVGRVWRVVNKWDIVPTLPPLLGYAQAAYGSWLPTSSAMVMEARPKPPSAKALNWDDHACTKYRLAVLGTSHATAPDWVVA